MVEDASEATFCPWSRESSLAGGHGGGALIGPRRSGGVLFLDYATARPAPLPGAGPDHRSGQPGGGRRGNARFYQE